MMPADPTAFPETNARRITRVEDVQIRQGNEIETARVTALEIGVARHDEQIKDHDNVLRELKDHLGQVVGEMTGFRTDLADFKNKAMLAAVLYFAGSGKADNVLHLFGF